MSLPSSGPCVQASDLLTARIIYAFQRELPAQSLLYFVQMRFPPVSRITCQISCLMALTGKNRKEKSFYPLLCWLWLSQGWSTNHCHFSCLHQVKSLALLCARTRASGELQTQSYPLASHDEFRKEKKSDFRFRLPLNPSAFQVTIQLSKASVKRGHET